MSGSNGDVVGFLVVVREELCLLEAEEVEIKRYVRYAGGLYASCSQV
jgi:hypothetical protein